MAAPRTSERCRRSSITSGRFVVALFLVCLMTSPRPVRAADDVTAAAAAPSVSSTSADTLSSSTSTPVRSSSSKSSWSARGSSSSWSYDDEDVDDAFPVDDEWSSVDDDAHYDYVGDGGGRWSGEQAPRIVEVERRSAAAVPAGAASLTFVFDVTGSMYDDLVQVVEGAARILATTLAMRDKPLYNYVLVPFHDPGQ